MNNRILELALQADLMRYKSDGINIKIEKFVWFMKDKGYKLYEKPYELNILAFRNKEKVYIILLIEFLQAVRLVFHKVFQEKKQ